MKLTRELKKELELKWVLVKHLRVNVNWNSIIVLEVN